VNAYRAHTRARDSQSERASASLTVFVQNVLDHRLVDMRELDRRCEGNAARLLRLHVRSVFAEHSAVHLVRDVRPPLVQPDAHVLEFLYIGWAATNEHAVRARALVSSAFCSSALDASSIITTMSAGREHAQH
jgi:hypothetical protein